jgi:hypothetical protein
MYCSACGTPLAAGLSYCNRCGMNLKERTETSGGIVTSYLTAISIVGVAGMGLMLGGAIALKNGAQLPVDIIGIFMLMIFLMVTVIEFFLCRQLSRLSKPTEKTQFVAPPMAAPPVEFRAPQPASRTLAEPLPSVTENTTRTLDYARKDTSS